MTGKQGSAISRLVSTCAFILASSAVSNCCFVLPAISWGTDPAENRLPDVFGEVVENTKHSGGRAWTLPDIVEVSRITDVAISDRNQAIAFVLKQSFVEPVDIRYGLYVLSKNCHIAKKILEAKFLDQLLWHPNTDRWTVRANIGAGIQLYDIDPLGNRYVIVSSAHTVTVGSFSSSIEVNADDAPQDTGVASFEWSPDGRWLWYSTYRLNTGTARSLMEKNGVEYEDKTMYVHTFFNDPTEVLGTELHLLRMENLEDRVVAFDPSVMIDGFAFNRPRGTITWLNDSNHIEYTLRKVNDDNALELSLWSLDVRSGVVRQLPAGPPRVYLSEGATEDDGYLRLDDVSEMRHLVRVGASGSIDRDYGEVLYGDIGRGFGLGAWQDTRKRRAVLVVGYNDRHGIVTIPASRAGATLARVTDDISHCSFTRDLTYGACVRQGLNLPPELVEVSMNSGAVNTLVRVNSRYSAINFLRTKYAQWVNRYGSVNDGYITYPQTFIEGARYPAIVVTHSHDARNEFINDWFQWEFPIQVFAEQGYVVLSVNEPRATNLSRATSDARGGVNKHITIPEMQFGAALNVVASMESAVQSLISSGIVDPKAVGIAGYSRGAEVVEYVMTQSKLFSVAVEGDAGGYTAGNYWASGWAPERSMYRQLYGGSPYDFAAMANYQRLSVSFRSNEFAGPLLQLFSQVNGPAALELHSLLRDARIPTELVFYPHENHIFWNPGQRVAAMRNSLDWFNYWLRGIPSAAGSANGKYARWNTMNRLWRRMPGGQ